MDSTREPKQKRAIDKKNRIIKSGFSLICKKGFHNTNTSEIAKEAGVSTGIVYQYFNDKRDIFIEGLTKYGDEIFFPFLKIQNKQIDFSNFEYILKKAIEKYFNSHKLSNIAHEEIMTMVHSDNEVATYFYTKEFEMTKSVSEFLIFNGFNEDNLYEKVHISLGIIDKLCHEKIYHKHKEINYDVMKDIAIQCIKNVFGKN